MTRDEKKQWLERYRSYKASADKARFELEELTTHRAIRYDHVRVKTYNTHDLSDDMVIYERALNNYLSEATRALDVYSEISNMIESLFGLHGIYRNEKYALILRDRYLLLLPIYKIAERLNMTERWVFRLMNEALDAFDIDSNLILKNSTDERKHTEGTKNEAQTAKKAP